MYFLIDPVLRPDVALKPTKEIVDAYDGVSSVGMASLLADANGKGKVGDKLFIGQDGSISGSIGDQARDLEVIESLKGLVDYGSVKTIITQDGAQVLMEG